MAAPKKGQFGPLKKGKRKALPGMKNRARSGKTPGKTVPGKSPYSKKKY